MSPLTIMGNKGTYFLELLLPHSTDILLIGNNDPMGQKGETPLPRSNANCNFPMPVLLGKLNTNPLTTATTFTILMPRSRLQSQCPIPTACTSRTQGSKK